MKRFLAKLIILASAGLIAFGIYTLDFENKTFSNEIKSLREKIKALDDNYTKKIEAVSLEAKKNYIRLEESSPKNIYAQYDCSVHIDTKVLENNQLKPFTASGTLIRNEAGELYILTNFHVFDLKSGQFLISSYARFKNPGSYPEPIELFAWDPVYDLALARFKKSPEYNGPVAIFGRSSKLELGSSVIAIGSSGGLAFSCSEGIVRNTSGIGAYNTEPHLQIRTPNVIVHSAAFANGNSGGPLITTTDGRVVGINYAVINTGPSNVCMNFYLAIPSDEVMRVLPYLMAGGEISHGWINTVLFNDTFELPTISFPGGVRPTQEGVVVASVLSDLLDEPKPKLADIVLSCNGIPIASRIELCREIMHTLPGSTIELELLRGTERLKVKLPIVKYELPP